VGILSSFFGRTKIRGGNRDPYFSVITSAISLAGDTQLRPLEKAGLVFNPVDTSFFQNLDTEIRDILKISGDATGTRHEVVDDNLGTRWVVLDDHDFEDLVSVIHIVGETITEHGFGDRLLAAVFSFDYEGLRAYWVYNIKRGKFYPLVLVGDRERDNRAEMRLSTLMEREKLPVESNLEQWYALWGIPF